MGQLASTVQSVPTAGPDPAALERAHAAMLANKALQHTLPDAPKPKPPPDWLIAFLDTLAAFGPVLQFLIWGLVIVGAALIIFLIVRELFGVQLGWKSGALTLNGQTDWRPDQEKARILLADADALAAEGRFEEAVHILLLRGVADITARRPKLIGPALTSRDIAAHPDLPEAARPAFTLIAEIVERSWFGGRPVDQAGWLQAREAYEQLVFSGSWT
ncbi:MAG: DUF4129 domain-containing protein [Caulobacter sp.]|nr:DUF4129 domain-containing protein [Caulobacter sp.]